MDEGFKRINYFTGQFLEAEDLNGEQDYHLGKRRLHHKCLHTPGIGEGCLEDLTVTALADGLGVSVAPGYALDGEGRDLYLPEQMELPLQMEKYFRPSTVYISIQYDEKKIDERPNRAYPDFTGHAFIREYPKVTFTSDAPDNNSVIELARIELSHDATRVNNPRDVKNPGVDEIDRRHVRKAGAVVQTKLEFEQKDGVELPGAQENTESRYSTEIAIAVVPATDPPRVYVATVHPTKIMKATKEARIQWEIETSYTKSQDGVGRVVYHLCLRNLANVPVEVSCRWCRLL